MAAAAAENGLRRQNQFVNRLPNLTKIESYGVSELVEIKTNLAKSIILNELRPGFMHWTNRLQTFINDYGLNFSKEDHINFIQIYLQVIYTPKIDLAIVNICLSTLIELLKKFEFLSRDDLTIEWKPIYDLYSRVHKITDRSSELAPANLEQLTLNNFISCARVYFDKNSTQEMLNEWRPLMCPFDMAMTHAFERFNIFLPTLMKKEEAEFGFKLWLEEFLYLWFNYSRGGFWDSNILGLFARVASDSIGLFDWSPFIPFIFSKILRAFGLSICDEDSLNINDGTPKDSSTLVNGLSQSFAYTNIDIDYLCTLIVSMIGSGANRNLCMEHIIKLFGILRSYYYPSNTSVLMDNFFELLQSLPEALIQRIRRENLSKYKSFTDEKTQSENLIQEEDVVSLVNCLKDIVLTAIFSKTHFNDAIKTYQLLCFLRPDIMIPPLVERIYSSFEVLIETHRYTSMLACLVSVPRELVTFNPNYKSQVQIETISLLISVLPGIDINDLNKFILTNQFLSNILSVILVCDCSPALNIRNDLTEHEASLCMETAKFEDFVYELLKKVFDFVDQLANDTSSESSASAAAAMHYSLSNHDVTDENVTQVHLIEMLRTLVVNSSKKFLKLIVSKLNIFLNGKSFDKRSGDIVASFCGFLVMSDYGQEAFQTFFDQLYETLKNFKESKSFKKFVKNERGEATVIWNLHLLSNLLKANGVILVKHMNRIKELIFWYRSAINSECIQNLMSCYNHLIASLTNIYSNETRSVNYSLCYDNEKEFFTNHLPIRDWGEYISLDEVKIDFHIPSLEEIKAAIDIVKESIEQSIEFLEKSLLTNEKSKKSASSSISKEENYRELNFIYHVLYGASRLLKRPSNPKIVTNHIETSVDIGLDDNVIKGLEFERAYLFDKESIYGGLDKQQLDTLLNMRENIINFIIKLCEKLIQEKSSDTIKFMLISRILATASITYGLFSEDFEKQWRSHFLNKSTIQNKLIIKKYPRGELIRRVMLQYSYRSFHVHTKLNELDLKIINLLTRLSIDSFYEVVRDDARTNLFYIFSHFPYSSMSIVPKLTEIIEKNNQDKDPIQLTKEQLEGYLLLLNGNHAHASFLLKQNWKIILKIWPRLFKCNHFEKETLQTILDSVYATTNDNYESFDNRTRIDDEAVRLAFKISPSLVETYKDETERLSIFNENCEKENAIISELIASLVSVSTDQKVAWRNQEISLFSLIFLLNSCERSPELLTTDCVKLFVDSLVHENVNFRRIGKDALCIILKMVKHKKQTKTYDIVEVVRKETNNKINNESQIAINEPRPGYREDNEWHLYDNKFISDLYETNGQQAQQDAQKWQNTLFLDKSYWGYYCWPSKIKVNLNNRPTYYTATDDQQDYDYAKAIKPIEDRFRYDAEFVNKFIRLSTIEESKGNEQFDKKMFHLFKALFRNFGTIDIINNLFEHLNTLVSDRQSQTHECSHKLAAELISGLIRGSKYWPLNDLKVMWSKLKNIFDLIFENISTETIYIWHDCFSNTFEDQDPRRMVFYLGYLQEFALKILGELNKTNVINMQKSSFLLINSIQILSTFSQFEWRIPQFWSGLLDQILATMSHTNKFIREIIPSFISIAVACDLEFSLKIQSLEGLSLYAPTQNRKSHVLEKFVECVQAKLTHGVELFDLIGDRNSEKAKEFQRNHIVDFIGNLNFLQTTLNWLFSYVSRSLQPFNREILKLIPLLCQADKIASYDDAIKIKLFAIRMFIPIWNLDENCINSLVEECKKMVETKYWRTRLAVIHVIKNVAIFNLFLLNDQIKDIIKEIVIDGLCDEQLEVRISSSIALTAFIHSNFIEVDKKLTDHLRKLSQISVKKKEDGKQVVDAQNLIKKHGGVLGLCSIVSSAPYDIPSYLPEIVTHLCQFTHDPNPIQDSVKKCLGEFRRTHQDNWQEHKRNFSENQLNQLADILISPNYYA